MQHILQRLVTAGFGGHCHGIEHHDRPPTCVATIRVQQARVGGSRSGEGGGGRGGGGSRGTQKGRLKQVRGGGERGASQWRVYRIIVEGGDAVASMIINWD